MLFITGFQRVIIARSTDGTAASTSPRPAGMDVVKTACDRGSQRQSQHVSAFRIAYLTLTTETVIRLNGYIVCTVNLIHGPI